MTVPRNSFTRYYRQFLRVTSIAKCYPVGCDDLGAPLLTKTALQTTMDIIYIISVGWGALTPPYVNHLHIATP